MTTRRGFLGTLLAAGTAPALSWAAAGNPGYIAAAREADGGFALFGLDAAGVDTFRVPLPARGHAGAGHPKRPEAVAFARRPGHFALVIDCVTGEVLHHLTPAEGRQFNGHGVFAEGGSVLFTSEQRADDSQGMIGLWDVDAGYKRIGEVPSGGIGPHDLRLSLDRSQLVVANGGIATDPSDRTKLNVPDMKPNLSYIGIDGQIQEQVELAPELHFNSIRHLGLYADVVAFAMQWEGPEEDAPPLLGLHRRGQAPVLALAPEPEQRIMKNYAGSIAFSGNGSEVAITSPRGGKVHRFSVDGEFLGAVSRFDVCGLAPHATGLLASDGGGGIMAIEGGEARALGRVDRAWDNHIVSLIS